jgi:hypothetical protein
MTLGHEGVGEVHKRLRPPEYMPDSLDARQLKEDEKYGLVYKRLSTG